MVSSSVNRAIVLFTDSPAKLLEGEQRGDASMQVDRLVGGEPDQAVDMPAGTAFENLTLGVDPADGAVGNDVPEQVGVGRFGPSRETWPPFFRER